MGKLGCNIDGNLDAAKFSEPLPWIGIYVAAASLACLIAMAVDGINGIRYRKFWFPCRFFSLNATSLTLIATAIKLAVDLNTPMPSRQDQLAKLSSTVFICTAMGNSMPSLGTMENKDMAMNIIALGILVITVIVNICIQLGTGVIYVFWKEHAFIMFIMLVLLLFLTFSALTIPTTKQYLEYKYNKKYELAINESSKETGKTVVDKLREDLMKYWMMAHTCNPQFVMGRSVTCTAFGVFCLLSAATLAEAIFKSYFFPGSFKFCSGESDYKWSTTIVLVIQTIAVGVGTLGPACRWFTAINCSCPKRGNTIHKKHFKVEHYWIQRLVEMKECPLTLQIRNRHFRKVVHDAKIQFLHLCIGVQTGIVITSKVIRLISIFIVSWIFLCCNCCEELKKKFKLKNSVSYTESTLESQLSSKLDLSRYILHLEGEDVMVGLMMKCKCDPTEHWIRMGGKKQPKYLINLLETSTFSQGFKGVAECDSNQVPSLDSEEPPNCWVLPVVTLTSIAVAIPNVSPKSIKQLICGVNQGLEYVRLIEEYLDGRDLSNIRKTAEVVWLGVELYHKWLDVDLHKLSLQGKSPKEILQELADAAKNRSVDFHKEKMNQCLKQSPSEWPIKVLAANSMYRISQTILLNCESINDQMGDKLFAAVVVMISDILGACLTNLQHLIPIKCSSGTIEERQGSVRHAVYILGKTEKIMNILEQREPPSLEPHQMAYIDEWRSLYMQKKPSPFLPSSLESEKASNNSSDLFLSIG